MLNQSAQPTRSYLSFDQFSIQYLGASSTSSESPGTWSDTLEAVSSDTCELCPAGRFSVPSQQCWMGVFNGSVGGSGDLDHWKFAWNHCVRYVNQNSLRRCCAIAYYMQTMVCQKYLLDF